MGTLSEYVGSGFCEMTSDDGSRRQYEPLVSRFDEFDFGGLESRVGLIEGLFRRQGITFGVYGEDEGTERTWPLDIVPRIISAEDWDHLEQGLIQRVRVLNAFLDDREPVERFSREIAPLILSGPPSVTGFAGGRPRVQEIMAFWPALIDRDVIEADLRVEVTEA